MCSNPLGQPKSKPLNQFEAWIPLTEPDEIGKGFWDYSVVAKVIKQSARCNDHLLEAEQHPQEVVG